MRFKYARTETEGGEPADPAHHPLRLHDRGAWFEVTLAGDMTLSQIKSTVMAHLYAPLSDGQEEARWRKVSETEVKVKEGDVSVDGAVDEILKLSDFVGVDVELVNLPLDHDPRLSDSETHAARAPPARVPLADDTSWMEMSASQPEPPDAARAILLERLVEKAEVAIETNDGAFQEEVIHGVWEMAVNAKDVISDFPRDAFRRVVALVEEGSADARWMACAAVWCLAVSAVGRAALLDVGGEDDPDGGPRLVERLRRILAERDAPEESATSSSDSSREESLTFHAVGALGVLTVDKSARAAYVKTDPSFSALLRACASRRATDASGDDSSHPSARRARRARNRRRVMAAETLASALIRDADARKSLIRAGGFEALAELAAESDHVGVKLAAATVMSTYARDASSNKHLSKLKNLGRAVRINAAAMEWAMRQLLGPCPPSPQEELDLKRAAEEAAEKAAEKAAEEAAEKAALDAAKADAESRGLEWEPPRRAEKEAAAREAARAAARADADARAAAEASAAAADAAVQARELIPDLVRALAASMSGMIRAVVRAGASALDEDTLRFVLLHARRAMDAPRDVVDDRGVAAALRVLAAVARDREQCDRMVAQGARPRTPPPFTPEEIERFELEEFQARKDGVKYVRPVRVKPLWDPRASVFESVKACLAMSEADDPDGVARVAAATLAGTLLEHTRDDPAEATGERLTVGRYRAYAAREGAMPALLDAMERDANTHAGRVALREACAAAVMYLAGADASRENVDVVRRFVAAATREDDAATHLSSQFFAAATWSMARSHEGRLAVLATSKTVVRDIVAAGASLVDAASNATLGDATDAPCVVALEFNVAAVWVLCCGERDPALAHGEVFEARDGTYWTVPRARTPSPEEAAALTETLGLPTREGPTAEDLEVERRRAEAAEAEAKIEEMRKIEDAGDAPPMKSHEAEELFFAAEKAVAAAEDAAKAARASAAEDAAETRRVVATHLVRVARLPPSTRTSVARRVAISAAWNVCARSTAARRTLLDLGFFDALEACATEGGDVATVECTTLAAAAAEGLMTAHEEVMTRVGGPGRLNKVAMHLARSSSPRERERGARALAFITSHADAPGVKATLLAEGALPTLLRMLIPPEDPEDPEPMDTDEDEDEDEDDEDEEDESGFFEREATPPKPRTTNEVRRSAELFAAAALLNLSTLPAAQIALAKRGLYTLLRANASGCVDRRHPDIGEGAVTGGDLLAGCISNVARHPGNRTRFYKLELRAKALERVLHNEKRPSHVGRRMTEAARAVGESFERAAATKTSFEKMTRRRTKTVVEDDDDDSGENLAGVAGAPRVDDTDAADADTAPTTAPEGDGNAPEGDEGDEAAAAAAAAADADAACEDSDWSDAESEPPAPARTTYEFDGDATSFAAMESEDWLATMVAASSRGDEDAVFADGLALLSHSMRKPLRHLWSRPEVRPDDRVRDPNATANKGLTRVVLAPGPRGAPEGAARWRPPVREYVQTVSASASASEPRAGNESTDAEARRSSTTFVSAAAKRMLSTERPGSVRARLAEKAKEVAAGVAQSAPKAFGGWGADDGLVGTAVAPDPSMPVARVLGEDTAEAEEEEARNDGEGAVASGGETKTKTAAPLKITLGTGGARNRVTFVNDLSKEPDPARRNASLVMFEHTPGAKVFAEAGIPAYPLPNGKSAFYYHSGSNLVSEIFVAPEPLPERPATLGLAMQSSLPSTRCLHTMADPEDIARRYTPVPALCPLPTKHTLDVVDPKSLAREAFGNLDQRMLRFDVVEKVLRKQAEENVVVPAVFREPYAVSKSVFAPRRKLADSCDYFDRASVYHKMFDHDWSLCCRKSKLVKFLHDSAGEGSPEAKVRAVRDAMRKYYDELEGAYKYYSVFGSGDELTMQFNEFSEFAEQCDLPDQHSKYCKRAHVDTLFKAANFTEKAEDKEAELVNKLNDDGSLTRFEFIEIIVRLADAKYVKSEECGSLAEAIETLFVTKILPNVAPEALLDTNEFREKRLYAEEVDDVYRGVRDEEAKFKDGFRTYKNGSQWKALEYLYEGYDTPVGGKTMTSRKHMTFELWIELMMTLDLVLDDGNELSLREVRLAFVYAQMRVVREFVDDEKFCTLNFTDWLEALARVAELFPLPPLEQLKREGFASGVEYLDSLRAAEKNAAEKTDDAPEANAETEASPEEATQKQGSLSALKFPHRASRAFAAPKTRPLATKLDDFLDYLFRSVWRTMGRKDAEYTLENAVEAFKGLKKARIKGHYS